MTIVCLYPFVPHLHHRNLCLYIRLCVPHMTAANPGMSEEEARQRMQAWFPTLKRWKKQ